MGIIVRAGTLPNGNVVSNVYMTFTPETIHCFAYGGNGDGYTYYVNYNVYPQNPNTMAVRNSTSTPLHLGNFPLEFIVPDPSKEGPWITCYNKLKELYPDSEDVYESKKPLTPEEMYDLGLL